MAIYTLHLPESAHVVQYRSDDETFRVVPEDRISDDLDFGPAESLLSDDGWSYQSRQQVWPGDSAEPTWWVMVSAADRPVAVTARFQGGPPIPVHRLGPIVVIEWSSVPRSIEVTVDQRTHSVHPFRPGSRGPAPHPLRPPEFPLSEHPPGSHPTGGWFGFTPL